MAMDIEVKTGSVAAIEELRRLVVKYGRTETTLVGIVPPFQNDLPIIFPESSRFVSYGSLPRLLLLYFSGLLPFFPLSEKALQVPLFSPDYVGWKRRTKGRLWTDGFSCLLWISEYMLRPLIWHLRRRGVMTFHWVANSRQDLERAERAGGCGVMSDDPEGLWGRGNR